MHKNSILSTISPCSEHALGSIEVEHILKIEFSLLGVEKGMVALFDRYHNICYSIDVGFSENDLLTYLEYADHDVYLAKYLEQKKIGKLVYLQQLLGREEIRDEIFLDIISPTIELKHSISGIARLTGNHSLVLSCHSSSRPTIKTMIAHEQLWLFLQNWFTNRISQEAMSIQVNKMLISTKKNHKKSMPNLTISEVAIVSLLAKGMDGNEVAKARGVTKQTIRSQIKQILKKTNSSHQNHLICKFYNGAVF